MCSADTERAFTGAYDKHKDSGAYLCAGCKAPLYKSQFKFNSGCGWPAFYDALPSAVSERRDADGRRVEIVCATCDGHLGHRFFGEAFPTPTDVRDCVNSASLDFLPGENPDEAVARAREAAATAAAAESASAS